MKHIKMNAPIRHVFSMLHAAKKLPLNECLLYYWAIHTSVHFIICHCNTIILWPLLRSLDTWYRFPLVCPPLGKRHLALALLAMKMGLPFLCCRINCVDQPSYQTTVQKIATEQPLNLPPPMGTSSDCNTQRWGPSPGFPQRRAQAIATV